MKVKCDVCRNKIFPKKEYEVEESRGALASLSGIPDRFDAMDCPKCGCQIILGKRIRTVKDNG